MIAFKSSLSKFALIAAALSLSACVSDLIPDPQPADVVYRLSVDSRSVAARSDAYVLRVDRPAMSKALQGQRIVVSPDGRRLAVAGQARWAEPLPALIQSAFLDVMSARDGLVGVLPTSGARSEFRVHLTVRNFEAHFDNGEGTAPLAVVHYAVTLSNASSRSLLGTYNVRETMRADSFSVPQIVEATDRANRAALNDISDWIEATLAKNPV